MTPCVRTIVALAVDRDEAHFRITVPTDRGAGRYVFEIVATTELGPEVAALWTFHVGTDAKDGRDSRLSPRTQGEGDEAWIERSIREVRSVRGLPELTRL